MNTMHFSDAAGSTHTLTIGSVGITLDGLPCQIKVQDTQIDLLSSDPARENVTVSPAAFWRALAGGDPTPDSAGLIQADALARWQAMQEMVLIVPRLRSLLEDLDRQIHHFGEFPLPAYSFDAFTLQLLRTYDGTDEHIAALARLLKQSPETIFTWLAKAGLMAKPGHEVRQTLPAEIPLVMSSDTSPVGSKSSGDPMPVQQSPEAPDARSRKSGYLWTEEHQRLLEEAVQTSQQESTNAMIKEIAARFDWPFNVVDYRLRQLNKRQSSQRKPENQALQEDDQAAAEPLPIITSPLADDTHPDRASALLITSAPADDTHLGQRKLGLDRGSSLWDVKIDGKSLRWELDVAYGNFPYAPDTHFVYREEEYVLERAWHSIIEVASVVGAKSPMVMELAEV